jgi:hypothetical protein
MERDRDLNGFRRTAKHGNSDKKPGLMFTSYVDGILGVLICDIHLSLPRTEAEVLASVYCRTV